MFQRRQQISIMKKNKSDNSKAIQEKMIEQALRTGGYVLPTSDDEVKEFERIYGTTDVILPEELQEPTFLYSNPKKKHSAKVKELHSNDFAMAARQGAENLPDEIKKRMEQDRRKTDARRKRKK